MTAAGCSSVIRTTVLSLLVEHVDAVHAAVDVDEREQRADLDDRHERVAERPPASRVGSIGWVGGGVASAARSTPVSRSISASRPRSCTAESPSE